MMKPRTINFINNTRKCCKCENWLSFDKFWKDKHNTTGLFRNCISCENKIRESEEYKIYRKNYEQTSQFKRYQHNYNKNQRVRTEKDAKSRRKRESKYRKNPLFVLKQNCAKYIRQKLQSKKLLGTVEYLGCSIKDLKWWLAFWFEEGMTWNNYGIKNGQWSIDHIRPTSLAKTEFELIPLFHYTNLQPMWHSENIKKSNKYVK